MSLPYPFLTPTTRRPAKRYRPLIFRASSVCSNSSHTSTTSTCDSDEEEYDEENEVSNWLLWSQEDQDQDEDEDGPSLVSSESSSTKPNSTEFIFFNAPGSLFLQIFWWIMMYFGLAPSHPKPSPPQLPFDHPSLLEHDTSLDQASYIPLVDNWDGKHPPPSRRRPIGFIEYAPGFYEIDDTEYLVPPTPGTNETVFSIRVSDICNEEKVDRQRRNELRIYRVPSEWLIHFGGHVGQRQFLGQAVRKPDDAFDTISVMRNGHTISDYGSKDEVWMLVGSSHLVINKILERTARRKRPFIIEIGQFIYKAMYTLASPFRPKYDWSFFELHRRQCRPPLLSRIVGRRIYRRIFAFVSPWLSEINQFLWELDEDIERPLKRPVSVPTAYPNRRRQSTGEPERLWSWDPPTQKTPRDPVIVDPPLTPWNHFYLSTVCH